MTRNQGNPHHQVKSCRGILPGYPLVRGYTNQLTYSFEHTARIFIEHKLNHCIERQIWQAKCISYLGVGGERALNQLLLQYYYFIGANCKVSYQPFSGDKSAHLHPKQRGPPKADLPFTQDTVNKKTRFQNVNPLLIPIFFIRMKSRRPHLAHLLVPGSPGLDSFARLSPLRIPFILFASS